MRTWLARHRSAILFGLLSWSIAHVVTLAAFAHIHPGFVVHFHHWEGPLAVAVLALTATSVGAVGAAALRPPQQRGSRISPATGTVAPAVFVAVEFAEYLGGIHEAPPATLLVIGCLVHALIGTTMPGLWSSFLTRARLRVVTAFPAPGDSWWVGGVHEAEQHFTSTDDQAPWGSRAPPRLHGVLAAC